MATMVTQKTQAEILKRGFAQGTPPEDCSLDVTKFLVYYFAFLLLCFLLQD